MARFNRLLARLDSLRDALMDMEADNDSQALLLIELNNLLARVDVILRAFVADETNRKDTN